MIVDALLTPSVSSLWGEPASDSFTLNLLLGGILAS